MRLFVHKSTDLNLLCTNSIALVLQNFFGSLLVLWIYRKDRRLYYELILDPKIFFSHFFRISPETPDWGKIKLKDISFFKFYS